MRILEFDFTLMKFSARENMFIAAPLIESKSTDITAAGFTPSI
jgi:hypothetical protein